jgi:hypothetical protein
MVLTKPTILALLIVMVSACAHVDRHKLSGAGDQAVSLVVLDQNGGRPTNPVLATALSDPELKASLLDDCGIDVDVATAAGAMGVPVLIALGKFLFDQALDERMKRLEELKKAAAPSPYSASVILGPGTLTPTKQKCFLLVRQHPQKKDELHFAALLRMTDHAKKAFTIEPVHVRALNAVAVTASEHPHVAVSFGMALKTLSKEKRNGVVDLIPAGQGSVSVSKVPLVSKDEKKPPTSMAVKCPKSAVGTAVFQACPRSDLIPYPPDNMPVSVSIAVSETGNVGFSIDAAVAESKAVKEALGPALVELMKEGFKDDVLATDGE